MRTRSTHAGGCLLSAAILIGTIWGILGGQMMGGILAGTAIGLAIAILVWLIDRRRA